MPELSGLLVNSNPSPFPETVVAPDSAHSHAVSFASSTSTEQRMQPRLTTHTPPATLAAAPSPSPPRLLASACQSMSCEKCYASKVRAWPSPQMPLSPLRGPPSHGVMCLPATSPPRTPRLTPPFPPIHKQSKCDFSLPCERYVW